MKLLILTLFLFSCATVTQLPAPEPLPAVSECAAKTWCWDNITRNTLEAFGKELLAASPKDFEAFCGSVDKKTCYASLIRAMSYYESGYGTTDTYTENFSDRKGNPVISSGLLQVSIESCKAYGASAKTTEDLFLPEKNLECAVRILSRWVPQDSVIAGGKENAWLGGARYWSVLRKKVPQIKEKMRGFL
jgi:hypothetical protein